jgi:DNA (cytosine-5)-methyltransferase 1
MSEARGGIYRVIMQLPGSRHHYRGACMTHLDLCSGIGGFHLAAEWAGFETIGFSEIEPYCCRLLAEKWLDIPNYGDIRTADFNGLRGRVTVLSAGVPCQPSSLAGKRRGSKDDRWLWETVIDVVECVGPAWVIFENPVGILSMDEFAGIYLRLESIGYEVAPPLSVPANAVGAKHRRQRVFIVGNAENGGFRRREAQRESGQFTFAGEALADADQLDDDGSRSGTGEILRRQREEAIVSGSGGEAVADAECRELQRRRESGNLGSKAESEQGKGDQRERSGNAVSDRGEALADADREGLEEHESRQPGQCATVIGSSGPHGFRLTEPPLCGRVDGVQNRSHRLKALGNAVVPQQAYPFFAAIAQVESLRTSERPEWSVQ